MRETQRKFELKVLKFIDDYALIAPRDHLLISVSGGPDSICLLVLLAKWAKNRNWILKCAYFNHGLRSKAKAEEKFVSSYAKKIGVPFVSGSGNTLNLKKQKKFSTEEAARKLRYEFLNREADSYKIVLGHHINDQVETFFVNLLKGSGLGGLSGMKAQEGQVIRPLLGVTKAEILEYLKERKISFCKDETNRQDDFLRNKVRLKLLPFIEKNFEWNLYKTLPKMMNVFKHEHEFIHSIAQEWGDCHIMFDGTEYRVDIQSFQKLPQALQRRIIKNILERLSPLRNFTSSHVEENRKLFSNPISHKKLMLPEGVIVEKLKNEVLFGKVL